MDASNGVVSAVAVGVDVVVDCLLVLQLQVLLHGFPEKQQQSTLT